MSAQSDESHLDDRHRGFHRRISHRISVSKHDVDKMPYPTALLATAILIVLGWEPTND